MNALKYLFNPMIPLTFSGYFQREKNHIIERLRIYENAILF